MKSTLRTVITILLLTIYSLANAQYDIVNKAEKLLSKEKYASALQAVKRSLQKDSTNAAAYQAFALYYTSQLNPEYDIDSAHFYNINAISYFDKQDEKTLQKLNKNNITTYYLHRFKKHIDSLAFQKAINKPALTNYNHFIGLYTTSHLLDSVILLRNQFAFKEALTENTYHSYRAFMERYPNAIQIEEAKARFEKLYFDESVKDRKLASYLDFLKEHPQSVYRPLAEQQILELSTINNTLSSYLNFSEKFSSSIYSKTALDYAYHIGNTIPDVKTGLSTYYDSLRTSQKINKEILFPYYNNGYGFINSKGEIIIPIPYQPEIQKIAKCPVIYEDFIWIEHEDRDHLITKSGKMFWQGDFDQIEDLGIGLIRIGQNNRYGLIHKSGKVILPLTYENIQVINEQYIAYQENGSWGIASTLGKNLIEPRYQSVLGINDFVLIQEQEKWAVINSRKIKQALETPLELSFIYDDYETFDKNQLMVFQGDKVNVISNDLTPRLPPSTIDVSMGSEVLITRDEGDYHLADLVSLQKLITSNHAILSNKTGVFYQKNGSWNIWKNQQSTKLKCDSLSLIGDHFIKYTKGDSLRFSLNTSSQFSKAVTFTNLNHLNESYLLIINKEHLSLLDAEGRIQSLRDYVKVTSVGDSLLIAQQGQHKGLINSKGETITEIDYDAIQRNDTTTFTLLKDSKFGAYNISDTTLIKPEYKERINSYSKALYIANKDNLYGLIDHKNSAVLPFEFDQIEYWTDSSALVKKGYQWMIYNIQSNRPILDQISQYSKLSTSDDFQIIKIFKENGFGILHNKKGVLIPPSFYNIHQVQQQNTTLYIAEKYIEEADFYVVVYYNNDGNIIFKHAMEAKDYRIVNCENP